MLKAVSIATVVLMTSPSFAQVRVITGDIQHIYGPGGQVLDDDHLRAQNEAAERLRIENERMELMRRQLEIEAEQSAWGAR
jgi:hypothetical protein